MSRGREWKDWGPGAAHKSTIPWAQSQKGKEILLYRFCDFEALPPISLYRDFTPRTCSCPHSTGEDTLNGRKQLAQGQRVFEPQVCLPADPGCGTESWFFFCDPTLIRSTREVRLSYLRGCSRCLQKWLQKSTLGDSVLCSPGNTPSSHAPVHSPLVLPEGC